MLTPRRLKHRKPHRLRGRFKGKAQKNNKLAFAPFGLKSLGMKEINSRQIEAARRAITRKVKRGGKVWIRIFPHMPITQKSAEVPMGGGKGSVEYYAALVKPGTMLFEMDGVPEELAKEALMLAAHKLPMKCRFVSENDK